MNFMEQAQKIAMDRSGIQQPRVVLGRLTEPIDQVPNEANDPEEPTPKKKKSNKVGMRLRKR